jgi:hypothetical protein
VVLAVGNDYRFAAHFSALSPSTLTLASIPPEDEYARNHDAHFSQSCAKFYSIHFKWRHHHRDVPSRIQEGCGID